MTGRDLIALLGDGTAGRLVEALGGGGRLGPPGDINTVLA